MLDARCPVPRSRAIIIEHVIILGLFLLCLLLLTGCVVGRYNQNADGTTFTVGAAFHKDSLKGLAVNSSTEKTKTGLKLSSADGGPDSESINAMASLIGQAAGIAAKTAAKP